MLDEREPNKFDTDPNAVEQGVIKYFRSSFANLAKLKMKLIQNSGLFQKCAQT